MKNHFKALQAVERLVSGDFVQDLEYMLYIKKPKKTKRELEELLKQSAEIIIKVYEISHAENSQGCSHPNWVNIKYDILKEPEY